MRPYAAAVVAVVAITACAPTRGGGDSVAAIIERWRTRTPVPGVVVMVHDEDNGDVTYASGTTTYESSDPISADNSFRIASITKLFVATVMLQLAEEGVQDIDAPARSLLSGVDGVDDGSLSQLLDGVTVRHLLSHTSGIPDYGLAAGFGEKLLDAPQDRWSVGDVINLVADRKREFAPGTAYSYSNTNYVLLGAVIGEATGTPWPAAVRSRVLEPLHLGDTYVAGAEDGPAVVPGSFDTSGDGFADVVPGTPWPALETSEDAAGAIVSTAADVMTFTRALAEGRVLDASGLELLTEHNPLSPRLSGYGAGAEVGHPDYVTTVWGHGGSLPGYRTLTWHVPSTKTTVVILSNEYRANPADLAELILRARGDLG